MKKGDFDMRKFIAAILLLFLMISEITCVFADEIAVYTENFDDSEITAGMALKNNNCYESSFNDGFAGKTEGDKVLGFARKTDSSDNSIYTMMYLPVTKRFIKYEINFLPQSEAFTGIRFKTGGDKSVSPMLYLSDDGDGQCYVLNRNAWNKIIYVITLDKTEVDKTTKEVSCKTDLYVNGKQICTDAVYTLYKDSITSSTVPLRFVIDGVGKEEGETALPELKTYIDDIDVCRYDTYPEIKEMPALIQSDKADVSGSEYLVYENTSVNDIKCSEGAEITVFDSSKYENTLSGDAVLSVNNFIAVRDAYNQISYYTVKEKALNKAEITAYSDRITATANLKDAVLLLAGYSEDGRLVSCSVSTNAGKADVDIKGSFASAKAFIFDSMEKLKPLSPAAEYAAKPTVACWGDSLTEGQGSTDFRNGGTYSYPGVLKTLTGLDVYNMGSSGETAMSIAARQGAVNVLLEKDIIIPADCTPIEIEFKGYNDDGSYAGTVTPRNSKDWNPCIINGIEGELTFSVNTNVNPRVLNWAKFTRKESGAAAEVSKGAQMLLPDSFKIAENADINVIFIGTNGVWNAEDKSGDEYADDLVILINKMLAKAKNPDKYIVIGLTSGDGKRWEKTDAALKSAYGEHLILPKERLVTEQALTDNNITPTEQDKEDIQAGRVPTSLRLASNDVHFNDTGYAELAKLVYAKMLELGYCD